MAVARFLDICGNSAANTFLYSIQIVGVCMLDLNFFGCATIELIHDVVQGILCGWFVIHVSNLSASGGVIWAHHGSDGWRGIGVQFRRGSLGNGYHIQGRQQARKLPNSDTER